MIGPNVILPRLNRSGKGTFSPDNNGTRLFLSIARTSESLLCLQIHVVSDDFEEEHALLELTDPEI